MASAANKKPANKSKTTYKKRTTSQKNGKKATTVGNKTSNKKTTAKTTATKTAETKTTDQFDVSDDVKKQYYEVNTRLAVETAKKAKEDGVKQFVFMSSMIIYGESAPYGKKKIISADTIPMPANFYGDSKWQADKGVRALADDNFNVLVLRPPMIYGKGSKGNYPLLSKFAKKLPVFPFVNNQRSMLYIENLCEFLSKVILVGKGGVFFPQNSEYIRTADMVQMISKVNGSVICITRLLNPFVWIGSKIPGKIGELVNKAFGNSCYDHELSKYNFEYCINSFKESIEKTERIEGEDKRALQLASVASMIDQFNLPNIQILQSLGYKVDVVADFTNPGTITNERAGELKKCLNEMGVQVYDIAIPRSLNPVAIMSAYCKVRYLIREKKYSLLHCHSPIGGVIARQAAKGLRKKGLKVIYTAHGFHFYDGAPLKNWIVFYPIEKYYSRFTDVLITINKEDYIRASEKFKAKKTIKIHGVGVDLERFRPDQILRKRIRDELCISDDTIMILSVGELNKNKNHESVIKALKGKGYVYVVVGKGELGPYLQELAEKERVDLRLMGFRDDVAAFYNAADIYVLPSIREGLNVSIMEAMGCGSCVAASNIRGNSDLIDSLLFDPKNTGEIEEVIEEGLKNKIEYGMNNLEKIEKFDMCNVKKEIIEIYNSIKEESL